jgi:hypothetical protein
MGRMSSNILLPSVLTDPCAQTHKGIPHNLLPLFNSFTAPPVHPHRLCRIVTAVSSDTCMAIACIRPPSVHHHARRHAAMLRRPPCFGCFSTLSVPSPHAIHLQQVAANAPRVCQIPSLLRRVVLRQRCHDRCSRDSAGSCARSLAQKSHWRGRYRLHHMI